MVKQKLTLTINKDLIKKAKDLGMNINSFLEIN